MFLISLKSILWYNGHMKKENLYKLIEKSFKTKNEYIVALNKFIDQLKDEGYFNMASVISNIKDKNANVKFSKINKIKRINYFNLFGSEIKKEAIHIKNGYTHNIIKSVFLYGKPGTGKTTFVNYLAKSIGIGIVELRLSTIFDSRYGETIKNFESFINNNLNTKQILFIDEAESLFRKRGTVNDVFESDRLLTIMLKLMDKPRECLIVLASNLKEKIDRAILRRFDMFINFDNANINLKRELINNLSLHNIYFSEKDMAKILVRIKKNIEKPKLSEIFFISRRLALEKLSENNINKICLNLEKSLKSFHLSEKENK